MFKDHEIARTDNSTNTSLTNTENLPYTVSKRKVLVSVTEDYNEDYLSPTTTTQQNVFPIYVDNDIDTSVYPVYIMTDINIQFTYTTASKSEATRMRDEIRSKLSQTRNINIHDIEYSYTLPKEVEDFISDVYDLKSRFINTSLQEYFLSNSTKRLHIVADEANPSNSRIAIYEKQIRIVGTFDFIMPDKIENEFDDNQYKISFNYKLTVSTPKAIVIRYPVMIGNNLVPYKYLDHIVQDKEKSKQEMDRDINYLTYSMYNLSIFESQRLLENRVNIRRPLNIPYFDEFDKRVGHKGYVIATSFLVQVDETDNKTLLDLKNLDDYYIDDDILDLLKQGEYMYVTAPYASILYFGLHQGDRHLDNSVLKITQDLVVKSTVELNLLQPVRVTIGVILDVTALVDGTCLRVLETNPIAMSKLIGEIALVYRDYKHEQYSYCPDVTNYFRCLNSLLYTLMRKSDYFTVCAIIKAIEVNPELYVLYMSSLKTNYPTIFKTIVDNCQLNKDLTKYVLSNVSMDLNGYIPKTVMTDYIVALRQEKEST
jgi:hypothetical protein